MLYSRHFIALARNYPPLVNYYYPPLINYPSLRNHRVAFCTYDCPSQELFPTRYYYSPLIMSRSEIIMLHSAHITAPVRNYPIYPPPPPPHPQFPKPRPTGYPLKQILFALPVRNKRFSVVCCCAFMVINTIAIVPCKIYKDDLI